MPTYAVRYMETWLLAREKENQYFKKGWRKQFKKTRAEYKTMLNLVKKKYKQKTDAMENQISDKEVTFRMQMKEERRK